MNKNRSTSHVANEAKNKILGLKKLKSHYSTLHIGSDQMVNESSA